MMRSPSRAPRAAALFAFVAVLLSAVPRPASASELSTGWPSLPAGEASARARLDATPRHGEYVNLQLEGEETTLRAWVVYPETSRKAGVVLVIHEIFGLSDWIRGVADQLAAEGFLAIVPDLVSGMGPGGGGTESAKSRDEVVAMISKLDPAEARKRLDVARAWAVRQPAANGRWATLGFCWGGARSFEAAAADPAPAAAVVYYGVTPDSTTLVAAKAPVLGFYGGDDARVTGTVPAAERALGARKKAYEPHVYPGAGHGFLRQQDGRDGANQRATEQAWPRTISFLRGYLKP